MADTDLEGAFWNSPHIVANFATRRPSPLLAEGLAALPADFDAKALDLGCGGGRNTKLLDNLGWVYHACDAHSQMVAATAALMNEPVGDRVIQAEMLALPYEDNYFQLVIASGVFHNAYSREQLSEAIHEAARVLAPGGRLYVNIFVMWRSSLANQRLGVLDPRIDLYLTEHDLRMTLVSPPELERMFDAAGLKLETFTLYTKEEFSGDRDVYQGWLIKS